MLGLNTLQNCVLYIIKSTNIDSKFKYQDGYLMWFMHFILEKTDDGTVFLTHASLKIDIKINSSVCAW